MLILRQIRWHLFIAFVATLYTQTVEADTMKFKIVDVNGRAVPDAVISFPEIPVEKQTQTEIMDQVNKQFSPKVLVVQKDQAVDFPNSDDIRHHVYSFSNPNQFEIKLFSGSEAQPLAFKSAGVVVLGCNIHDNMIGYIYVNDNELTIMTDNEGVASVDFGDTPKPAEFIELNVWHPELSLMQTERVKLNLKRNKTSHDIVLPFTIQIEAPKVDKGFKKKFGS
ncbi:MAG: plastocyanin [Glaciecola sp.]